MKIDLEALEQRDIHQSYLKETILLSDIVVLYRHEQVLWTQELGLLGMQKRPQAFFATEPFRIISAERDHIVIQLEEWLDFSWKLLNAFKSDFALLRTMKASIETALNQFEQCVDNAVNKWNIAGEISTQVIEELFELYALTDAYSILNYVIPRHYFQQQLQMADLNDWHYSVDHFLVSLIEPHRNMVRRKKLEIVQSPNDMRNILIDNYIEKDIYYDYFTEWLYFNGKETQKKIFYKSLNALSSTYNKKQIDDEIKNMKESRHNNLLQRNQKLDNIFEIGLQTKNQAIIDLYAQLEGLAVICTEEESRHMTVCKFFYLMGALLNTYKIDVSRTSLKEIKTTIGYLIG